MKRFLILIFLSFVFTGYSIDHGILEPSDTLNKKRVIGVSTVGATAWVGSISGLYFVWYKDFEKSKFHTFNDSHEWGQMDKMGHLYASWQFGRSVGDLYEWSGVNHKNSAILGASFSLGYMSTFEFLDATNVEWGFSWSDVGFNTLGTLTYFSQEYFWNEQFVKLKFSAHNSNLAQYRPEVLGNDFASRLLKDYNGQTYWLSFNPVHWFAPESKIPKWINFSMGYSINNQLIGDGGTYVLTDGNTQQIFEPYRQLFFSFDVDFEKIPTKSKFLKVVFRGLNFVKVPFPTLEISEGKLGFRPLYF